MPIEDTLTLDMYLDYFAEQLVLSPRQEAVVGKIWAEKYELLMPLNIRPVTYTYTTGPRIGQTETRWVIEGYPGLWSYESMREIYERILEEEE